MKGSNKINLISFNFVSASRCIMNWIMPMQHRTEHNNVAQLH